MQSYFLLVSKIRMQLHSVVKKKASELIVSFVWVVWVIGGLFRRSLLLIGGYDVGSPTKHH